jgi:Bardet-Biedl syndrome 1 protein
LLSHSTCTATTGVRNKFQLASTPVFVASTGLLDVDYRIVVACRNGHIYTVKNNEVSGLVIELESQPCGLVRTVGGAALVESSLPIA